jgi:hypothetical protein
MMIDEDSDFKCPDTCGQCACTQTGKYDIHANIQHLQKFTV